MLILTNRKVILTKIGDEHWTLCLIHKDSLQIVAGTVVLKEEKSQENHHARNSLYGVRFHYPSPVY